MHVAPYSRIKEDIEDSSQLKTVFLRVVCFVQWLMGLTASWPTLSSLGNLICARSFDPSRCHGRGCQLPVYGEALS
ncbi:hypothetical protein BJX65DRAFT_46082 [Aspergillus insuetus]